MLGITPYALISLIILFFVVLLLIIAGHLVLNRNKKKVICHYIVTCPRDGVSNKPPRAPGSD